MDEVEKMDDISGSLVKQVIFPPMQCASLGHEGLVYNWKQSMREHVQLSFTASAIRENVWVHLYEHFHV